MTKNIWVFFLCALLVFITQFNLLQPILQYQLFNTSEDWTYLIYYHTLDLNFLDKMIYVWRSFGLHTSAQLFHIGILSDFLMFNYPSYQVVNVTLKAIGTISFFPLVLVLFKDKKLAFLATILFGISSGTAGSFLWVVKGSEYIGIMLMNAFLITYYFVIIKNSKKLLLLSSLLFLSSYLMAPPRMFPLLPLVPLVEIYWLFNTRKLHNLKFSIIRIIIYILPVILVSLPAPVSSCCPFTSRPLVLLKEIYDGNWHNLLDPFAGIGWTIFTNDFWKFFGKLELETFKNFGEYLTFLFSGPFFIFAILTLFLCPILSKKPAKFFALVFSLNLIAEILMFFIAGHQFSIPANLVTPDNPGHFLYTKYPTLAGIYIFIVAFAAFLEWRKNRINKLLKAIWVGPIFAAIFLWPTWVIMGPLVNDWVSVHWYFGIPAMGTTLYLAAILVLIYEKLKHGKFSRVFAMLIIFSVVLIFYQNHKAAIAKQYLGINPERVSLKQQQQLHKELVNNLGETAKKGDILVYLDIAEDQVNLRRTPQFYKDALVENGYADWLHFRRGEVPGCIEAIFDRNILRSAIQLRDNEFGFIYKGRCLKEDDNIKRVTLVSELDHFYKMDNFYAFRIQDGEFIDIKHEIIKDLVVFPLPGR